MHLAPLPHASSASVSVLGHVALGLIQERILLGNEYSLAVTPVVLAELADDDGLALTLQQAEEALVSLAQAMPEIVFQDTTFGGWVVRLHSPSRRDH